ncbi:hypothetical protein HK102_007420 [Quaeritorhiza haematococci]|nr:hypothetical protein HK102_007420 [Quaeritorhiza haematococci]
MIQAIVTVRVISFGTQITPGNPGAPLNRYKLFQETNIAMKRALVWFRKDNRLHDNPSLLAAIAAKPDFLTPVYIIDSHYVLTARVGIRRWMFLLESLRDLDASLRKLNTRLLVLRGDPMQILPALYEVWGITHLYHTKDTEPFWQFRDRQVKNMSEALGVQVVSTHGHTLWDPFQVVEANKGKAPLTLNAFMKVIEKLPKPAPPQPAPASMPPLGDVTLPPPIPDHPKDSPEKPQRSRDPVDIAKRNEMFARLVGPNSNFDVPEITEFGFQELSPEEQSPHKGGETNALKVLEEYFKNKKKVATFEKPKTSPAAFKPADTTVLSPHLKFGTLSSRLFYQRLHDIYREFKNHSKPPVSLLGQLYWREFYYAVAAVTPNYHKMEGNPVCLQNSWFCKDGPVDEENPTATEHLKAWSEGRTGYPWIDAIMTQLRLEGWIHHLARHSVACFLTRGDLYISWERGAEVFEELLLDHDSALNIGNWLWLSASAFFTAYLRVYSPVAFAKKYDKTGKYIRKYVPALKSFPTEYIFEPWKAPLAIQQRANCIIGRDYPRPIVIHEEVHKINLGRMKEAYSAGKRGDPNAVKGAETSSAAASTSEGGKGKGKSPVKGGGSGSATGGATRGKEKKDEEGEELVAEEADGDEENHEEGGDGVKEEADSKGKGKASVRASPGRKRKVDASPSPARKKK